MFCAAIPAALAVGANAQGRRNRLEKEAEARREDPDRSKVSPKAATALVVAGLAVASIVYHTQLSN
jgi:uncharacterized membrane protein YidH (DUF202 family)